MIDEAKQIEVIRVGIAYWIEHGVRYLEQKKGKVEDILSTVENCSDISSKNRLGMIFGRCLDLTALSFFELGGRKDIQEFNRIMKEGLHKGYERAYPNSRESGIEGFQEYVVERDEIIGCKAGVNVSNENQFIYSIEDPFVYLVDAVTKDQYEQISTRGYLDAKMDYFFGADAKRWSRFLEHSRYDGKNESVWRMIKSEKNIPLNGQTRTPAHAF